MNSQKETEKKSTGAYHHRTAFGCWINDMRNEAMPHENWPYVVFDEQTEKDIIGCLDLQRKAGFNEFDVFGLLVSRDWPLDIRSAVDENRRRRVHSILKEAHDRGIKLIYGLGVYSWGFDRIIESYPEVQGPNPHAMCGYHGAGCRKWWTISSLNSRWMVFILRLQIWEDAHAPCAQNKEM